MVNRISVKSYKVVHRENGTTEIEYEPDENHERNQEIKSSEESLLKSLLFYACVRCNRVKPCESCEYMACIVNSIKAFKERDLAVKDLSNYVKTNVSVCDICKDHERCQENEENWYCDWKWRGVPDD